MTRRTKPPFRADHVGSLLRPKKLLQARDDRAAGRITAEQLRTMEDAAIRKVVQMQEDIGLQGITDGEYRRIDWFMDFKYAIGGVEKLDQVVKVPFVRDGGTVDFEFVAYRVAEKLKLERCIFGEDFTFLKSVTKATPKQTIPSPSMMHYPAGRGIDRAVYPDTEEFFTTSRGSMSGRSRRLPRSAAPICRWTTPASPFLAIRNAERRSAPALSSSTCATSNCSTQHWRAGPQA